MEEYQISSGMTYEQHMARLETFIEPMAQVLSNCQMLTRPSMIEPEQERERERERAGEASLDARKGIFNIVQKCLCCCHHKALTKSPRAVDRIFGTLSAAYSTISYTAPRCSFSGCARSCVGLDLALSLTYFFPLWLLRWGINLQLIQPTRGFKLQFRVIQFVEYSSPIYRCAYEGDFSRLKALLKGKLGSPFDVTFEPRRSLLGVLLPSIQVASICD